MSIRDHALLVSLSVNKPQMTQKDDKATHDAEVANNAHGAGNFRKDLYPKALVAPIAAVESAARSYIASVTYPWSRGDSLLPSMRFIDFTERIGRFDIEFNQAVTAFLNNWANVLTQAQASQGDLFDPNAYPDLSTLRGHFRFRVAYRPVPATGDFRVQMSEDAAKLLREQVESELIENNNRLLRAPLERLKEHLARLHKVAKEPDRLVANKRTGAMEARAPVFRDSLVQNIVDEIELLQAFEDALPEEMHELADRIRDTVPAPGAMRDNPDVRKAAVTISSDLLGLIDDMLA